MRKILFTAVAAALLAAGAARAETVKLHANMSSSAEVPPPANAHATVEVTGTLDTATKVLTYDITYSGLTGPATAMMIHGAAGATANARWCRSSRIL